jgi:hypothetical protein
VKSVATTLRAASLARILDMPVAERIALALAIGDDDLDLFVRASGLDRAEALRRLRAGRRQGRLPSRCASPDRP